MDESLKILLNEDKDKNYFDKENLFINKNPLINKIAI